MRLPDRFGDWLGTKGVPFRSKNVRDRVKRWAKRVLRRQVDVESRHERRTDRRDTQYPD